MFTLNKTYFCADFSKDSANTLLINLETAISSENHREATRLFGEVKKRMKQRIQENYIQPIEMIKRNTAQLGVPVNTAFIIMGINCILIELLFEIKHGIDQSNETVTVDEEVIHLKVLDAYKEILPLLDNSITAELACKFYKGIRCGVIHQGQTKDNTALTYDIDFNHVFEQNGDYYVSNPLTVFEKIKEEYKKYWNEISMRNYDHADGKKIIRKFSHILYHIK